MAWLEELRGKINVLQRRIQLVALLTSAETDRAKLVKLQQDSLKLQAELRITEAEFGKELKKTGAGRLDAQATPPGPADAGRPTPRDQRQGAKTTKLDAGVELRMLNVPTSMVHLLARARTPLVTVTVKNTDRETRRVQVTTWIEGFSAKAVSTKEIPSREAGSFDQFPTFFPDRVATVTELTTAALHVHVEDLDSKSTELYESYPIPLLARTTAVLWTQDPAQGSSLDLTEHLAAWVTPNAQEILDFLRRAADFSKLKAMLGYQGAVDADGIREHVRAIFEALKVAGITYVNSPISFGNHQGQFIQRVRLPRESLRSQSANCIDGTVLMASLLEATAIDAGIVLVPGHAYLAWRPRPGVPDDWEFVETTMIGTASFDEACQVARDQTVELREEMRRNPRGTYVKILPIPELRAAGITPME